MTSRPRLLADGGLVILSYCFPPMSVGPSFVVARLLSQFDLEGTIVFSGQPDRFAPHQDRFGAVNATVERRDVPKWWPQDDTTVTLAGRRVPLRLRAVGNVLVGVRVAAEAVRALRDDRARALLVVYPKQHFLLAACLASAVSRKPLLVYFMDVYVEALPRGHRVARMIERYVAKRADLLFAMSDAHRQQLVDRLRRYGVAEPRVVELPHPWTPDGEVEPLAEPLPGRPSILFTGTIYGAQADAIRRLVDALDAPPLADFEPHVHLLSQMTAEAIAPYGIAPGRNVSLRPATNAFARAAQRAADVLFLPIAFDAKPHVVRTASPSKMPEYLASGRPILVHAPADSYVADYARRYGFAEVVSDPDPESLAAALRRLVVDERRRDELVANARRTLRRHEAPNVASVFRRAVVEALP